MRKKTTKDPEFENYKPDPKELHLFHVKIEQKAFDQKSGEKLSKPRIQKFTKVDWEQFRKHAKQLGWSWEIKHVGG